MPQTMTDAQILEHALQVVTQAFVGALTTVDENAVPHTRWMGAATGGDGLALLYTLTGRSTRKIQHIENNPHICWVFSSPHFSEVITLMGTARVLDAPVVQQQVWDRLADCAKAYGMNALSNTENLEFLVIESSVNSLEYLNPGAGITRPRKVDVKRRDA